MKPSSRMPPAGSAPKFRPAETIAASFAAMRSLGIGDRAVYSSILRSTLETHANFIGVWSVWEPGALDGRDGEFRDEAGHDGTGRFVPFWHRRHGRMELDPVTGYDQPSGTIWYRVPRETQRLHVIDPYLYPVGGMRCLIMSQVAPIVVHGRSLGVAGIDISVESWAEQAILGGDDAGQPDPMDDTLARGFAILDESGAIMHCTARAKGLLDRYEILHGSREPRLPAELHCQPRNTQPAKSRRGKRAAEHSEASPLSVRRVALPRGRHSVLLISETISEPKSRAPLTPREREVRHWLSQGKSNDEIAIILGISSHTVKHHLDHVFEKLGVNNRYAAALADDR